MWEHNQIQEDLKDHILIVLLFFTVGNVETFSYRGRVAENIEKENMYYLATYLQYYEM